MLFTRVRRFAVSSPALSPILRGSGLPADFPYIHFNERFISELVKSNGKPYFPVDTLALVRRVESSGLASKQAEAITGAIMGVFNVSVESVSKSVASKPEMHKVVMTQELNMSKFNNLVQSSEENHFSLLQHENEKMRHDIEKLQSEMRYEIDKVSAGQRLNFNLEKGRIRDILANKNAEMSSLTKKLDQEIHALRTRSEAAKYEVIQFCIGLLVSLSAVSLAAIRIFM